MSVQTCGRCGQLLLPEIVRELGQGKRCPFCGADLDERSPKGAQAAAAPAAASRAAADRVPLPGLKPEGAARVRALPVAAATATTAVRPAAPGAVAPAPAPVVQPSPPPPKNTVFRTSAAPATAPAPAAAIAVATPTPEPEKPANPVLTLVPTPAPEAIPAAAPPVPTRPAPANLPVLGTELVTDRRRRWLTVSVALALAGVTCFVIAHAVSTRKPTQPAPPVAAAQPVAPPVVAALPPPEPANPAPPADHVAEAKVPEHRKVHRSAHERRGAHERKEHRSHASRGKHGREVALQTPAAPAAPEDDSAARTAYGKGNRLLLTGDTGGAIAAYEEATRLAPSSPAGYRGLGLAYEKQGKSAQAARAFRKYLKLAPGAEDRALIAERLQLLAPQHKTGKRAR